MEGLWVDEEQRDRGGVKKMEATHELGGACRKPVSGRHGLDQEGSSRGIGKWQASGSILEDGTNRLVDRFV